MELLFQDHIADIVQYISLPLELVGFLLMVIEIFWPNIASKLENSIDDAEEAFKKRRPGDYAYGAHIMISFILFLMSPLLIGPVLLIAIDQEFAWQVLLIYLTISMLVYQLFKDAGEVLHFWNVTFEYIRYPFVKLLAGLFQGLNKLSGGAALGSIGLILTLAGISGELYQVITLYSFPWPEMPFTDVIALHQEQLPLFDRNNSMFNEYFSAFIQTVSCPIEILGLFFLVLEIYFKGLLKTSVAVIMGLFLSCTGLLCELYQVITMTWFS